MKHKHWKVIGFDEYNEKGDLKMPVEITMIDCLTETEALKQAEKTVKRKHYTLRMVWDCNTCSVEEDSKRIQQKAEKLIDQQLEEDDLS